MGNEPSRPNFLAVDAVNRHNREFGHFRQELENVRNELDIQEIRREQDTLKYQAEWIKTVSMLREEAIRRDRENRENTNKMFMMIFIIVVAVWFLLQREITSTSQNHVGQCYKN